MSSYTSEEINGRTRVIMDTIRTRPEYLTDPEAVTVLSKAVVLGNAVLRQSSARDGQSTASHVTDQLTDRGLLYKYCKFLIEYSYAIELKLVNDEFTSNYVTQRINVINGYLDEVLDVIQLSDKDSSSPASADQSVSRVELLECVYWRKGALMYMYCHTARDHKQRLLSDARHRDAFLSYALAGVRHLAVELSGVRGHADVYQSTDKDSLQLVQDGIFSSTHILACMYAAELCYWLDLMGAGDSAVTLDEASGTATVRQMGSDLASRYTRLATGPLSQQRWSTEKVEEIISYYNSQTG